MVIAVREKEEGGRAWAIYLHGYSLLKSAVSMIMMESLESVNSGVSACLREGKADKLAVDVSSRWQRVCIPTTFAPAQALVLRKILAAQLRLASM